MKFVSMVLVIASALLMPRLLALVTVDATVLTHALWDVVFGAAGGLVGAVLTMLLDGEDWPAPRKCAQRICGTPDVTSDWSGDGAKGSLADPVAKLVILAKRGPPCLMR